MVEKSNDVNNENKVTVRMRIIKLLFVKDRKSICTVKQSINSNKFKYYETEKVWIIRVINDYL